MTSIEKRRVIFHALTVALIIASVCFSVFRFQAVFWRVLDALKDAGTSAAYYLLFVFFQNIRVEDLVTPTLGTLPENLETVLPLTIEEFECLMEIWQEIFFDSYYFELYLELVGDLIYEASIVITQSTIPFVSFVFLLRAVYSERDNEHGKDSKYLRFWKKLYEKTVRHCKFYYIKYRRFLKARKWYRRALLFVWAYNLSALTILIELSSWVLLFSVSWDLEITLALIAKVLADLTVPLFFLPWWISAVIGYKVLDKLRCKIAMSRIRADVQKVKKFLLEHLGAKFLNGKQRSKKTSLMTQFKTISETCILRPQAQEGFLNRAKQFPEFPWMRYLVFLNKCRRNHKIANWTGIREFINFLRWADANAKTFDFERRREIRRYLRTRWDYKFEGYCFGYDTTKNAATFDDKLDFQTIFDALEGFGKQYWLYAQPTPLDASNYPIRSDFEIVDEGNLPEFKAHLFEEDTKASFKRTQWSHRINWDAFRLKPFNPGSPENNSFEYGIRCSMEHAKERKNQLTRRSSDKEDGQPTQDNDGVETDTKIRTHLATVDNFTYMEDLADDQRAASLGADNLDLMTKIYIKKSHGIKFYVPFFAFDELIYIIASAIFDAVYLSISRKKGSNTALIALCWKLYLPIYRHYTRYKNMYSYYPLELKVEDGADNEVLSDGQKLPLISIIAYRGRFRTDALGEFYYRKIKGTAFGLNDVEMYTGKSMTLEQMQGQNSYMIKDLTRIFRGTWKDPLKEWEEEQAKKAKEAKGK